MTGTLSCETPTIIITAGGSARRIIKAANHRLLFDSTYARKAEKATCQCASAQYVCFSEDNLKLTADGYEAQYVYGTLGPHICPAADTAGMLELNSGLQGFLQRWVLSRHSVYL